MKIYSSSPFDMASAAEPNAAKTILVYPLPYAIYRSRINLG